MLQSDLLNAVIIDFPALVKARTDSSGKRLIEVEASVELVDDEGDLILQKALLDSADAFVKNGHIDVDHISELGHRFGIQNPESYIIGRPVEVKNIGDGRTSVVSEIMRSRDGFDPSRNRFDAFWATLTATPPVEWRSSIYGFPKASETIDCRNTTCEGGVTRFLIKALDWRSLAMTRRPVNNHIKGCATIVTAKAFAMEIAKDFNYSLPPAMLSETAPVPQAASTSIAPAPTPSPTFAILPPRNLDDAYGQYHGHMRKDCPATGGLNSTVGFREHFKACCGLDPVMANVWAHALSHHLLLNRRRT